MPGSDSGPIQVEADRAGDSEWIRRVAAGRPVTEHHFVLITVPKWPQWSAMYVQGPLAARMIFNLKLTGAAAGHPQW